MQARPPPAERFIPPTAPGVPVQAMQNLIPRLATTINDIDGLKNQIAAGNMDGSMPNWDTLLQRYSMLLGRVQQLSAYIAQEARKGPGGLPLVGAGAVRPPAAGAAGPSTAGPSTPGVTEKSAAPPALSEYLVHALRPLPTEGVPPEAVDTLFQVINTMQLPQLDEAQRALLADSSSGPSVLSLPGQVKLLPLEELRKLDDNALVRLTADMRSRLQREHHRASAMVKEIQRREDEYDWAFRITEDDDDDEKDDLFDDEEEAEEDVKMKPAPEEKAPNPREGWKVADYLKFLDSGDAPPPPPAPVAPAAGAGTAMVVG